METPANVERSLNFILLILDVFPMCRIKNIRSSKARVITGLTFLFQGLGCSFESNDEDFCVLFLVLLIMKLGNCVQRLCIFSF